MGIKLEIFAEVKILSSGESIEYLKRGKKD